MGDVLPFRPHQEMGKVLAFPVRNRNPDAVAIGSIPAGARIVSPLEGQRSTTARSITGQGITIYYEMARDHDDATGILYAMDDDTAPCEMNPDPFADDMDHRDN